MERRPTIIDVARHSGVSKSTVSLVLQNSPSVREDTAKRVREAMAELGYVYNRAAANLRSSAIWRRQDKTKITKRSRDRGAKGLET